MKPDDDTRLLVAILAQSDAVWLPLRAADAGGRATIYQARLDYTSNGCRWQGDGGAGRDRTADCRRLAALESAGRLTRRGKLKTSHVLLSADADAILRRLCGLASFNQVLPALDWLACLLVAGHGRPAPGGPWVSECELCETAYDHPKAGRILGQLQNDLLPLLAGGLLMSNSDCQGRASYALTAEGDALAQTRITSALADPDAFPPDVPPGNEELTALYYRERAAAREELRTADPDDPAEIGPCPLPCSWPGAAVEGAR